MTDPEPAGECEACGEMVPIAQLARANSTSGEIAACCSCRGVDPEDDEEETDEDPDFSCGTCGGSGGGEGGFACPACSGRGINYAARKAWLSDLTADRDYDERRDRYDP